MLKLTGFGVRVRVKELGGQGLRLGIRVPCPCGEKNHQNINISHILYCHCTTWRKAING